MAAYLLTHNPKRWYWEDLQDCIENLKEYGYYCGTWSCRSKKVLKGDRIFLIRLGSEPRGIFASGFATSGIYEGEHWQEENKTTLYVDICLDVLLAPESEPIFPRTNLNEGILANMHWDSQASGISISDEIAAQLEIEWNRFLATRGIVQRSTLNIEILPEEVVDAQNYYEGATKQIRVNVYERNAEARKQCIGYYGLNCYVCGFNFENVYGKAGVDFIHVHHLKPLSEIGSEYKLNPRQDLRPVCPNCHAMIHKRKPAYTIAEVQAMLAGQSR